jgi:hypothetical protein
VSVSCSIHGLVPFSLPLSLPSLLRVVFAFVALLTPSPPSLSPSRVAFVFAFMVVCSPSSPPLLAHVHFTAAFANMTTSLPPPLFAFTAGPLPQSHVHDPPIVTPLVIAHDRPPRLHVHDRARVTLARKTLAFTCAEGYLSGT